MASYRVEYYDGRNRQDTYKNRPIDSLRKAIANGQIGKLDGHGTLWVYKTNVKKIQPGTPYEPVGQMWKDGYGNVYWKTFPDAKTYRVSKKTGGLLDFNKYWRYA